MTVRRDGKDTREENVQFSDQAPQWQYAVDSMPDPTYTIADAGDAKLENFFKRPLRIASYSWGIGTQLFENMNPWTLFFENPRVINRITNFNLMRCKLHVRVVLNGNSFHYGRAIASYQPLHLYDNFTRNRSFFNSDVIAASQRPHVWLDPTTSQGGDLILPFVWMGNAMKIPDQHWREMGEINIRSLVDLKHANGGVDPITISVFAWAEEVTLSVPTANEPGALVPQMGEADEYGVVSGPASVLAKVAGALSKTPVIGPYARATEMAANATASIARIFGFSRPVSTCEIQPYTPKMYGNLVNTNVPDTSNKLTFDIKQELTVDPRTMGLGSADELSIKSIAQRETYLTTFAWQVSDTPDSLLYNSLVSPVLWGSQGDEILLPACAFAALPFQYWRGTLRFRFQIVASAYHKGRLRITYDPSYPLTNEYNTNYSYIVDLASERDFSVDIGWGDLYSFASHRRPGVDQAGFGTFPLTADPGPDANGIISMYVVNELTTPNSVPNNDVEVIVSISAGEDFEVFAPDTGFLTEYSFFQPQVAEVFDPQMGDVHPDADSTMDDAIPMRDMASKHMAKDIDESDNTDMVFFSDPVASFRQCLKRYMYHTSIIADNQQRKLEQLIYNVFPYYRGRAPDAVHQVTTPVPGSPYNYANMTLLNYLTPAYICRRGGIRWKYAATGDSSTLNGFLAARRVPEPYSAYLKRSIELGLWNTPNQAVSARTIYLPTGWDGMAYTPINQNPVLEVEYPYFERYRFTPARLSNMTGAFDWLSFQELSFTGGKNSSGYIVDTFVSTGEDFQLAFFVGAPPLFYAPKQLEPLPDDA